MHPLSNARIHFNEQGTPVASDFDDIYFSNEGGLAETDYVFLQQNALPERWLAHPHRYFHVLETGFGTGANFLLCYQRFRAYRQQHPTSHCQRLYFSSFEKYPLSSADLRQALTCHQTLTDLCQALVAAYPSPVAGCHRLVFEQGQVILDLWLGDVNQLLPSLTGQQQVDAIFLDGFAPAKNPDMWQDSLFNELFRLARPGATLATFTSAGMVKRGLQQAGFVTQKVKGFGRKREMLTAKVPLAPNTLSAETPPAAPRRALPEQCQKVSIIGGGLAALCSAAALLKRGVAVELYCADSQVAQGASHNRQGALYPNLSVQLTAASQLQCQSFGFARQFYQHYQASGLDFPVAFCGLLHLATTEQLAKRQQKMAAKAYWPASLVRYVSAEQASALAGIALQHSGIFLPDAGWLSPQAFCQALFTLLTDHPLFKAKLNTQITALQAQDTGWQLETSSGQYAAERVVVATGADLCQLPLLADLPINRLKGQVSHVKARGLAQLQTVICHKGYLTPAWQGEHSLGATFERDATDSRVTAAANQRNVEELQGQLGAPSWSQEIQVSSAKAAFRATTPDKIPLCGALDTDEKLWVLSGLGARGLLFAPLLAEVLACQLSGEPIPLAQESLNLLTPTRFCR